MERRIQEHEFDSPTATENRVQCALHDWVCPDMALSDVSDLEKATVLGAIGGEAGALSAGFEVVAEGSEATDLDSCGERGRDVVGACFCPRTACSTTESTNLADDGNTHGSQDGRTPLRSANADGVRPNRFLLLHVESLSKDSSGGADFSRE
jgi:hypothetical protein